MLKKTFSILLIGLAFISCEKEIIGPDISAVVNFSIVNSNGNDLLNPSVIGAITEENTEVFLLKNGTKVRLYQGNLDAPKFLKIISQNGENVFRMFFDITNENFKDDRITQYIRFKDGSEIEVVGEFNSNRKNNKILQQIWINGTERTISSAQSTIVIVK